MLKKEGFYEGFVNALKERPFTGSSGEGGWQFS